MPARIMKPMIEAPIPIPALAPDDSCLDELLLVALAKGVTEADVEGVESVDVFDPDVSTIPGTM